MAKKTKPSMPKQNRVVPHLAVAAFCENVLREPSGVTSLIRMVDVINATGATKEMPPGVIGLKMFTEFKSGGAIGKRMLRIVMTSPSGTQMSEVKHEMNFLGGGKGAALETDFRVGIKEAGLYWFNVYLGETLMTRMPLRVNYQQQTSSPAER